MTIDQRGAGLWRRIAPAQRTAFFSCLITGLLVHLYAFTNLIPNSDGLSRVHDLQQMTISGRWFLHYASALNSYTQMPAAVPAPPGNRRRPDRQSASAGQPGTRWASRCGDGCFPSDGIHLFIPVYRFCLLSGYFARGAVRLAG